MAKALTRSEEKPFDRDSALHGGFIYTTNAPLSSQIANRRLSLATREIKAREILDIGCGDGTYTVELLAKDPPPVRVVGLDPAGEAIKVAAARSRDPRVSFLVGSAYALPFADRTFDCAYLRGVLHHMQTPEVAVREALRVAREIVIIEPNGYNPVLKLIERASRYHREHDERSYSSARIRRWITAAGGRVSRLSYVGLVPFFCPDRAARTLKRLEPLAEGTPGLRQLACAVSVIVAHPAGN